jgi:hypothetical protein
VARRRTLHDLTGENAVDLGGEAAAQEQEMPVDAPLLHRVRNRRLDIDLGEHLDEIGIRHQEIRRRRDRAERLIQQGGSARCIVHRRGRTLGLEGVHPVAEMLGLADTLHHGPVAADL